MTVIYVVLPLALVIAGAAIVAFIWAVRSGQLDDLDTPGIRILLDDTEADDAADRVDAHPRDGQSGA